MTGKPQAKVQQCLRDYAPRSIKRRYPGPFPEHLRIMQDIILDPDEYSDFLQDISDACSVRIPKVPNMMAYRRELIRRSGWGLPNLLRWKVTVFAPDLTIRELLAIIETGSWPESYIYPQNSGR